MTWTIEALNREHPLPEGWGWELWENGDTSKYPVAQRPDGTYCAQLYGERLVAVDSSGEYRGAPADVALAVLLANKAGGPAKDETASLRRQLEHYQQEARRAVAVQWATAHDSVHVWVDEDSTHDTDELTMRPSELDEALGDSVILITALQLRRLLAREVKDGPVARHYRDLLDASRAARDWVCEHGDADLPLAVRALVEAARPLRISDMIDMLARDEARSLRMRRAELREVIDRGGADAEAAAAELAEVDARLDEIPLGDTPEQAEAWRVLHKIAKSVKQQEDEKLATEAMPALAKQCAEMIDRLTLALARAGALT